MASIAMTLIDLKGHLCYLNFETFRGNIARINYVFTRESNILHVACNFNCLIENKGFFQGHRQARTVYKKASIR